MRSDLRAFVTLFSSLVPMFLAERAGAQEAPAAEPGWEQVPMTPEDAPAAAPPPAAEPPPPLPPAEQAPAAAATVTSAEVPGAEAPLEPEAAPGRALAPRQVDIRATLSTDPLLAYVGLGANADVGIVRAGPGTFAVGGGLEHAFCGSVCWFPSAPSSIDFNQRHIWPQARASYHVRLRSAKDLDLYPIVALGPVFARSTAEIEGLSRYTGTDTTIGLAMGAGMSWFLDKRWFFGAEAKIRYAAGAYEYSLTAGNARAFDRSTVEGWTLNGLDAAFAFGARVP